MDYQEKFVECQYWLLDIMLEKFVFTQAILPDNFGSTDEYPFVDIFSESEKLHTLFYLFEKGYLLAVTEPEKIFEKNIFFVPTKSEIENAIVKKNNIEYSIGFYMCLSEKGGEKWESLSNPNWSIYTTLLREIKLKIGSEVIHRVLVFGKKLSWARKRASNLFGNSSIINYNHLYPNIVESKTFKVTSCKPIYWKGLGNSYLIMISFNLIGRDELDKEIFKFHRSNMIGVSSTSLDNYWYTHPYGDFRSHAKNKLIEMGYEDA
jgi:hypothetical protein